MFKKLKKKIEEESSGLPGPVGVSDNSHGPGLASPMRLDQPQGQYNTVLFQCLTL